MLPLALDLARTYRPDDLTELTQKLPSIRSIWPTVAVVGGFFVYLGALLTMASLAEPSVGVGLGPRIYTNGSRADFLFATVWNRSDQPLTPRFAMQTGSEQPFFWSIVEGPETLLPGETADYQVDTNVWYEQFDLRKGGLLTVADRDDYGRRSSVWIPPLEGHAHLGQGGQWRLPVLDERALRPVRWSVLSSPLSAGSVRAAIDSPRKGALDFYLRASEPDVEPRGASLSRSARSLCCPTLLSRSRSVSRSRPTCCPISMCCTASTSAPIAHA